MLWLLKAGVFHFVHKRHITSLKTGEVSVANGASIAETLNREMTTAPTTARLVRGLFREEKRRKQARN